ncbi:MAG: hypothetical protein LBG47_06065 [Prevotellaceae bacterium]|nr:hypothetical protein [Prevotellaceae bacterium]
MNRSVFYRTAGRRCFGGKYTCNFGGKKRAMGCFLLRDSLKTQKSRLSTEAKAVFAEVNERSKGALRRWIVAQSLELLGIPFNID